LSAAARAAGANDGGGAAAIGGEIPPAVRARFAHPSDATLRDPHNLPFLVARLMEEGSGAELRWLVGAVGREPLVALLRDRGGRQLSRRSRAFWQRVLGVASAPAHPLARDLWPLA
jgi:hypothetical protein